MEGLDEDECKLCHAPTSNLNNSGTPVCERCEEFLKANAEPVDEIEYWQSICAHPPGYRTKDHRCKFCNKVIEEVNR